MDIHFQNAAGGEWRADCALAFCLDGENPANSYPELWKQAPWLEISPGLRDFSGKKGACLVLYGHPDNPVSRVMLWGLGGREAFSLQALREAVAKAVQACRGKGYAHIGLPVEGLAALARQLDDADAAGLAGESALAALVCLQKGGECQSVKSEDDEPDPKRLSFLLAEKNTPEATLLAVRRGEAEAAGLLFARALSNAPANRMTPENLAEQAETLAKKSGFACTVFDAAEIEARGMGALAAVGRGAEHGPRFIILEHCPKGRKKDKPVVVAGKGITFDTGGISLKPPAKMHEMKGDMGGAAAVLGLFTAIAAMPDRDELPRLVGLIPAAENMPGGRATRPGDVVATLSGKTVEILNTDAEGRLVLCDALAFAQQEYEPAVLIDIATLTGACVIALGDYGTGLFSDDRDLRDRIMDAAKAGGDLVWPLPLWDEYDQNIKSDIADMTNMGPREGAAINAALFLRRFVEKTTRWAHLDIAGPGYVVKSSPLLPVPGGTGMGVRLLARLLRTL